MQFRDHPATSGKRDFYGFDPRQLKVDTGYNVRDLTTPENKAHIEYLKASIAENGVKVPLEVRLDGDDVYVVAGHCRHAAVMALIAEGVEIKSVPVIPEAKGTSAEDRVLGLIVSNSGKPLSALELAHVIKRLADFGWTDAQIAGRVGWKSTQQVRNHLELLGAPADVREMVRKGDVSATTAVKVVRREGKQAGAILKEAKAEAERTGKGKVTQAAVNMVNGTDALTPRQVARLVDVMRKIMALGEDEPKASRMAGVILSKLELV